MPSTPLLAARARRGRRAGLTSVELAVSMVILLVAVGGTLSSISSSVLLGESARETSLAYLEAQRMVERLRAENFEEIFARYNADPTDDVDGEGSGPGSAFDIDGFFPTDGDEDGRVGEILFPVGMGPGELEESVEFGGRTYDLDANGTISTGDVSDTYVVLPMRVRIEWSGASGNRFVELQTLLTRS